MNLISFIYLVFAATVFISKPATSETAPLVPLEAFAALPNLDQAKLSPNGDRIAYLISNGGRQQLQIQGLSSKQAIAVPPLRDTEIIAFYWANKDIVLMSLGTETRRFKASRVTQESKLISFNVNTHESKWLGKPKNPRIKDGIGQRASQFEQIRDFLPDDPDHILVELDFELDTFSSVYKINVRSGRRQLIQGGRKGIQSWYTDREHNVRLGMGYSLQGKSYARFKDNDKGWLDLEELFWFGKYSFADFTQNSDIVYVRGPTEYGTKGLFKLSLSSGKIVQTLFAHERVDYSHMLFHPISQHVVGVAYFESGLQKSLYFDPKLKASQQSLEAMINGASISIVGKAKNKPLYLVLASNAQTPGLYFLFDQSSGQLSYLDTRKPGITPRHMATMAMVDIEARDGTALPSVLTLPQNAKPGEDLRQPAVILPHGGPRGVDTAHWDEWAQFLANRGYVVLQPNFRGSIGYGYRFQRAGIQQWGGLMQDDLTDATHWLIEQGYADKDRICVMGASYGGYAALMGVIKEQGLYQCAISINGVANLPNLKARDRINFVGGSVWIKNMGLKDTGDKLVSPYHRAAEIRVPVLLIASKDDTRVPYSQSKDLHKRLKKRKLGTYVQIKEGGHHLDTLQSRITILKETEKFLAKHIGD